MSEDATSGESVAVLVAVVSAGERDLSRLLGALNQVGPQVVTRVYTPAAAALPATASGAVRVRPLDEGGYCVGRNAALVEAREIGAEFLVFIDDDEVPVAGWLSYLLDSAQRFDADVVTGPVYAEPAPAGSFASSEQLRPPRAEPHGAYAGHVATNNTLIRTAFTAEHDLRFDMAYNLTGGEDTDFFRRARACGATVVWDPRAVVLETIDADRMTLSGQYARGLALGTRFATLRPQLRREPHKRAVSIAVNAAKFVRGVALWDRASMGEAAFGMGRAVAMLPWVAGKDSTS